MENIELLEDLFQAYYDARKNKRNTKSALAFERQYEHNIIGLYEDIVARRYEPLPSYCFIVRKPVRREVFAADFRDRVVHHLIFSYLNPIYERLLINDCYSCRKGKGTSYGIERVSGFMRSCSDNYTKDCYVLKIDMRGYFMSINKTYLSAKIERAIDAYEKTIPCDKGLLMYLVRKTIFTDPIRDCIVKGSRNNWIGLPKDKSLFFAQKDCGLPIGNITSQLFGNIYLNDFDHFMKEDLGLRQYGRYVDDCIFMHRDKKYLIESMSRIRKFLEMNGNISMHPRKIYLQHYIKGVPFLGVYIKPYCIYAGKRIKGNFYRAIRVLAKFVKKSEKLSPEGFVHAHASIISYIGNLRQWDTYRLRGEIKKHYKEVLSFRVSERRS